MISLRAVKSERPCSGDLDGEGNQIVEYKFYVELKNTRPGPLARYKIISGPFNTHAECLSEVFQQATGDKALCEHPEME